MRFSGRDWGGGIGVRVVGATVLLGGCLAARVPDAGVDAGRSCPRTLAPAELARARKALEAQGVGEHEVAIGDGGCFRLREQRSDDGPRVWELFELTGRGPRLRMRVKPDFGHEDYDLSARHLERFSEWVVSSEWTTYAELIELCRERADGGDLLCSGFAIH